MARITKPLKAATYDESKARFPYLATPKIDGIRFMMIDGQAVSISFKPIRNYHIQETLQSFLPDGVDGELTVGNFQSSTSGVMSYKGKPEFTVWIFDYVDPEADEIAPYDERMKQLTEMNLEEKTLEASKALNFHVRVLSAPVRVENKEELKELERTWVEDMGYEGVMLRDPKGTYKMGRSTLRQNIILKVKRFIDAEAVIIDFEEEMFNGNEAEKDAFGRTKRSKVKENLVPKGTLGALVVHSKDGVEFKIGTGFTAEQRKEIWENRWDYIGKFVKFKSMEFGVKDAPRHPVFLGFRHEDDIS